MFIISKKKGNLVLKVYFLSSCGSGKVSFQFKAVSKQIMPLLLSKQRYFNNNNNITIFDFLYFSTILFYLLLIIIAFLFQMC